MKKYISIILLIILMLTIASPIYAENESESETINVKAKVVQNNGTEEIVNENEPTKKVQKVLVRILEGEYENEEYEMEYLISKDIEDVTANMELKENTNILVSLEEKDGEVTNIIYNALFSPTKNIFVFSILYILLFIFRSYLLYPNSLYCFAFSLDVLIVSVILSWTISFGNFLYSISLSNVISSLEDIL